MGDGLYGIYMKFWLKQTLVFFIILTVNIGQAFACACVHDAKSVSMQAQIPSHVDIQHSNYVDIQYGQMDSHNDCSGLSSCEMNCLHFRSQSSILPAALADNSNISLLPDKIFHPFLITEEITQNRAMQASIMPIRRADPPSPTPISLKVVLLN